MSTIGDTDGDYVARIIRDKRIVKAHCGGMSQEISALVGEMGQPFDHGDGRVAPVGVCW